jgi:hypothetical protein
MASDTPKMRPFLLEIDRKFDDLETRLKRAESEYNELHDMVLGSGFSITYQNGHVIKVAPKDKE